MYRTPPGETNNLERGVAAHPECFWLRWHDAAGRKNAWRRPEDCGTTIEKRHLRVVVLGTIDPAKVGKNGRSN
jgi:hypothetical protein